MLDSLELLAVVIFTAKQLFQELCASVVAVRFGLFVTTELTMPMDEIFYCNRLGDILEIAQPKYEIMDTV